LETAAVKPAEHEISKYGLKLFKWAVDGVAAVVNPENNIRSLAREQLMTIFSGDITNWKNVGGENRRINLYIRDKASGTRKVFWKKALNRGDVAPVAVAVVSNGAMKTAVANDPCGIGYISVGHIDESVKGVTIDGIAPTRENVQTSKYKVARGLYSLTRGEPEGLSKLFIDYLFSPEGQDIVAEKGFIPVR